MVNTNSFNRNGYNSAADRGTLSPILGVSIAGEHVTGGLEYITFRCSGGTAAVTIAPSTAGSQSQNALDFIIQTIATRGQPIIMGAPYATTESAPTDLPGQPGASATVWNLRVAIEHVGAWLNASPTLAQTIGTSSVGGSFGFLYDATGTATGTAAGQNFSIAIDSPVQQPQQQIQPPVQNQLAAGAGTTQTISSTATANGPFGLP
jgi:hypothetical protein